MELYYKDYGSGHPLIILHGFLGASGNWHSLSSKVFGEAFHVFAVDLRNHGRSPHADVHDYPSMVDDLLAFMQAHDLDTAHVLGHSMGGKTAMHFATTHPERVDKLIVADMAPKAYPAYHTEILEALQAIDPTEYESRQAIDDALATSISSWPVRQFLLKNLSLDAATKTYTWQMNLDVLDRDYEKLNEALPENAVFDGPTLFIRGDNSNYISDDDRPFIQRHFPQADLVTIPDAGHWVHAEAPEPFAEAVMAFLQGSMDGAAQQP